MTHASDNPCKTPQQGLALFMLWQDTDELARFLVVSKLTWDKFQVAPLNRASVCELLGIIGIHARGVDAATASRLGPSDGDTPLNWERLRSLARLADERTAHTLDADGIKTAWDDATVLAPALRRAVANDVDVVRLRARWKRLLDRAEGDWPQPESAVERSKGTSPLLARVRHAADEVAGDDFPARRLWLLEPGADTAPLTVAVEHDETCSGSEARRLHEGLSSSLGRPVDVMPQEQVHPLLWDDVVPRERLMWRSPTLCHDGDLVLPAIAHHHEHEHD